MEFGIPTPASGPTSITSASDGNLWFTEFNSDKIARITPAGAVTAEINLIPGSGPLDIVSGPDGNLYFTERFGDRIGRINPKAGTAKIGRITTGGTVTTEFALPIATNDPENIVTGPDGALYFTETGGDKIGRITTAGAITEFTLQLSAVPSDITLGADGALFF